MSTPSPRQYRVSDLIHRELALLLKKEIHDPRLATILLTAVRVSPDLKQARVFYTVTKEEDRAAVQEALKKAAGYLRHLLADATKLRYIPQLRFVYDVSVERGERLASLIDQALAKDQRLREDDRNEDEN